MHRSLRNPFPALTVVLLAVFAPACEEKDEPPPPLTDAGASMPFDAGDVDAGSELEAPSPPFGSEPPVLTLPPLACFDDNDGLIASEERDAGLDPCKDDTDGDGCIDSAELLLGGCDDPRRVIAIGKCYTSSAIQGTVAFAAPSRTTGNWPRLTLIVDASMPARTRKVSISAQGDDAGVARTDTASFLSVVPRTILRFEVSVNPLDGTPTPVALRLVDENAQVLDQGQVVVFVPECPLVI